jgi:hypothetical protein
VGVGFPVADGVAPVLGTLLDTVLGMADAEPGADRAE